MTAKISPTDPTRRRFLRLVSVGTVAATGAALGLPKLFAASVGGGLIHTVPGEVALEVFADDGRDLGLQRVSRMVLTDAQWREKLSAAAFAILRGGGTERAFSGVHERPAARGIYRCAGCATALYDDATQFDSGTGWPSFWQPISPHNVIERRDLSFAMVRTEIRCARCQGHLGHVFHDGPPPTGLRYCMNSPALHFVPRH